MLLGILSDTHGSIPAMDAAIALLQAQVADVYLHCGDIGGEEIIDRLAGLKTHLVFGNNDWDRDALQRYAQALQIVIHDPVADLDLDGRKLLMLHGDDSRTLDRALKQQSHDYILHGHTHVRRDERVGKTRIINPGALYRTRQKWVATLDLPSDKLTFFPINTP